MNCLSRFRVSGVVVLVGLAPLSSAFADTPEAQRLLWCRAVVQEHLFRLPPNDASRGELTLLYRSLNQRAREALRAAGHGEREAQGRMIRTVEEAHARAGLADVTACRQQFGESAGRAR